VEASEEQNIFRTLLNFCTGKFTQLERSTNFWAATVPLLWLWTEYCTLQWPYWLFWNKQHCKICGFEGSHLVCVNRNSRFIYNVSYVVYFFVFHLLNEKLGFIGDGTNFEYVHSPLKC